MDMRKEKREAVPAIIVASCIVGDHKISTLLQVFRLEDDFIKQCLNRNLSQISAIKTLHVDF